MEKNYYQHESQAAISFSRITGYKRPLVGSSILHDSTIMLRISPTILKREFNEDTFYTDGAPYIEVEMSQAQFAEAITTMNNGTGTPVTLRRLNNRKVEDPVFESKVQQIEQEFKKDMVQLDERLRAMSNSINEILEKKTINKGDKESIRKQMDMLHQEIYANIPFVQEQFSLQMAKTVQEAKSEVESFITTRIQTLGMEKARELQNGMFNIEQPKEQSSTSAIDADTVESK